MKILHADHYFQIGSLHYQKGLPCQDFALSGANAVRACAIISDGCSSGRHTDIGARLQALSLLRAMKGRINSPLVDANSGQIISEKSAEIMKSSSELLGLSQTDLLSTAVYAYLQNDRAILHLEGDGVIARKYKDGRIVANLYEWIDNIPIYPAYAGNLESFLSAHGGDLNSLRFRRSTYVLDTAGESEESHELSLGEAISGVTEFLPKDEMDEIEILSVFSDGVAQIEGVKWTDAVREFLSFKNFEGEFLKRRMMRAIRDFEKAGSKPSDDISGAVIRITDQKEEE
ncbi:MAG TPA: protein phosphatase 2C domain-containing protein [Candidatus Paceibacterota bacterium]